MNVKIKGAIMFQAIGEQLGNYFSLFLCIGGLFIGIGIFRTLITNKKRKRLGLIIIILSSIVLIERVYEIVSINDKNSTVKTNYDSEIIKFSNEIKTNPNLPEPYFNRGIVEAKKGDYDGAINDYTKVIEIEPKNYMPYYNRGIAKGIKGDYDGAILDYTKSIELNPYFAMSYCNRGANKFNKEDYDGALLDFEKAIELDPKFSEPYCDRGSVKIIKRDYDGAILDFTKAIEFDPKSIKAKTGLKYAEELKRKNK
jgi:tetratricopeptide (TPR) repeat protein